jgi:uncharacterized membrane protein
MKHRIWELDAFRGICLLGMVFVHFMFDLVELYGILDWAYPAWFRLMTEWGGMLFVILSGICATLGRRSVRRGLIVFGCGLIISAATYGMYRFGFADKSIIIYFGVLHCLGVCMVLWHFFRKLPSWLLLVLGAGMILAGWYLSRVVLVDHLYLVIFGFTNGRFFTSDYFPLLPNLGYFLVGAVVGRRFYGKKQTLLPRVNDRNLLIRALCFCGRHSLEIYLLHQPILAGICMLMM